MMGKKHSFNIPKYQLSGYISNLTLKMLTRKKLPLVRSTLDVLRGMQKSEDITFLQYLSKPRSLETGAEERLYVFSFCHEGALCTVLIIHFHSPLCKFVEKWLQIMVC